MSDKTGHKETKVLISIIFQADVDNLGDLETQDIIDIIRNLRNEDILEITDVTDTDD